MKLRQKKLVLPKTVLAKAEHEELFEELIRCEIKGTLENEKPKEHLTLYELESLPEILKVLRNKSEDLKAAVEQEINQYRNCPETYWEEQCSDSDEDIEEDSLDLELELEELKLLLQAMQFRRKRLVNLMTKTPSPDAVDELRKVEEEVERIRLKVKAKESINGIS